MVPGHSTPPDLEGLAVVPLLDDEVRVAVPAAGPWGGRTSVALADLAGEEWIAGCPRCRGHLVDLAAQAGFVPRIRYETDDYVAVLGLVGRGPRRGAPAVAGPGAARGARAWPRCRWSRWPADGSWR